MTTFCSDLAAFVGVFVATGMLFFVTHVVAVALGMVRGAGRAIVILAIVAAAAMALVSWILLGSWFSRSEVHALASVTAPIAFLGFCGIYILVGPVTVDRSITLSILRALSSKSSLEPSELRSVLNFDAIFEKRLHELARSGTIDFGNEIVVTKRGRKILRAYERLGRLLDVKFQ